jgi:hypothetical protein
MEAKRYGTNQSSPLFIEGYFYFLNYPYLQRMYALRQEQNRSTPRLSIRRPHAPQAIASPWSTLFFDTRGHQRFPPEPPLLSFEA